MKVHIYSARIAYQGHILPFIRITYNKVLTGYYEVTIGWFNREVTFQLGKKLRY